MNSNIEKINEAIYDNNYKICFIEPYKEIETIIYGRIQNFNPCGNVVIFVENKSNLYIIPYTCIKWMMPNGLSKQYKDLISLNAENERLTEEVQKEKLKSLYWKAFCTTGKEPTIFADKDIIEYIKA